MFPCTRTISEVLLGGGRFEFLSLPFGLGPAPMVFTMLLKPVVSYLRLQGIRILVYLDDMLLMAQSVTNLEIHVQTTIQLLRCLGFVLNMKKCQTTPSQTMEFLGFLVDSRSMTLSLPETKVLKIRKECRHMRNQSHMTGRQLAHLIGLLTSCLQAILQAPLHYRALQRLRNQALVQGGTSYDKKTRMSKEDLLWWIQQLSSQMARPIRNPLPDMVLETDVSTKGWGANYPKEGTSTGGPWSAKEATHHINWLELKGAFLALQCFLYKEPQQHSHPTEDGQPGGSYICEQEGGNKVEGPLRLSTEAMGLVHQTFNHSGSTSLARTSEHNCRLRDNKRLESGSSSVQSDHQAAGEVQYRFVRRLPEHQTGPILQLETRPQIPGSGCSAMGGSQPIPVSSFLFDSLLFTKVEARRCSSCPPGGMVPCSPGDVNGCSKDTPPRPVTGDRPRGKSTPPTGAREAKAGGLAYIRQPLEKQLRHF